VTANAGHLAQTALLIGNTATGDMRLPVYYRSVTTNVYHQADGDIMAL